MFLIALAESENNISEVYITVRHFTSQECIFTTIKTKIKCLQGLNFSHKNSRKFLIISLLFGFRMYEGWNFNRGNYVFTTDTK